MEPTEREIDLKAAKAIFNTLLRMPDITWDEMILEHQELWIKAARKAKEVYDAQSSPASK